MAIDLEGMEWILENPVGMLCMQEYMVDWEENMNQAGRDMVVTEGGRLLCMESLVQEAHSPVDQHGVLETERGPGSGYRQGQGACRQQGGVRQVESHLQVGAEQSGHEGGTGQEGTEGSGASEASQGDHQVQERTVPEAEDASWAGHYFEEEDAV